MLIFSIAPSMNYIFDTHKELLVNGKLQISQLVGALSDLIYCNEYVVLQILLFG